MPANKGFVLSIKNNQDAYTQLYPKTTVGQVIGWEAGEVFGPYQLTLSANGWQNNQQTLTLDGITSTDIPFCVKILSGTAEDMIAQDKAYSLLDPKTGIESLDGQVRFTVTETPTVDITVQVGWTR